LKLEARKIAATILTGISSFHHIFIQPHFSFSEGEYDYSKEMGDEQESWTYFATTITPECFSTHHFKHKSRLPPFVSLQRILNNKKMSEKKEQGLKVLRNLEYIKGALPALALIGLMVRLNGAHRAIGEDWKARERSTEKIKNITEISSPQQQKEPKRVGKGALPPLALVAAHIMGVVKKPLADSKTSHDYFSRLKLVASRLKIDERELTNIYEAECALVKKIESMGGVEEFASKKEWKDVMEKNEDVKHWVQFVKEMILISKVREEALKLRFIVVTG